MIAKLKQSWRLLKASITVVLRNRRLLWFPVLTTVLTGFIALFFLSAMALPIVLHHTGYHLNQIQHWSALVRYYFPRDPAAAHGFPWGSLCLPVIYFVSMFLATFFNVAFYSEIISAFGGKEVSLRRGLMTAWSRLPSILAWSCLAGLVGWLIRTIEERMPLAARIVAGLIGLAWSIAAVCAIPVIIQEQPTRNPIKILQKSAVTLKRTWGESLIGYLGIYAGSILIRVCLMLPVLLVCVLAVLFKSAGLLFIAVLIMMLGVLFAAYVCGVAGDVYRCALYIYAAEGVVPEPYNQDLLDMAWVVSKPSGEP